MNPLTFGDVQKMLIRMGDTASNIVLIGGQAVNFWAERYLHRVPELAAHGPYTSKDVDFCGSRAALIQCAHQLHGKALLPVEFDPTPNTGQLIFIDDSGAERVIDFLHQPFGLEASDVLRTSLPVDILDDHGRPTGARFRVMHPERCLESRVHNVVGLPGYDRPAALSQLRAAIVCTREFLLDLLVAGRIRPTLDLAERLFHFCHDDIHGRAVFDRFLIDPFSAVFTDSRLPDEFNSRRYPQMLSRLESRRTKHV